MQLWRGGHCREVKIRESVWTVSWDQKSGCCREVAFSEDSAVLTGFYIPIFLTKGPCCSYSVIIWVRVVLKRTVVGDSHFDNLSRGHLQSQGQCQSPRAVLLRTNPNLVNHTIDMNH